MAAELARGQAGLHWLKEHAWPLWLERGIDWLKNYQATQVQYLKNAPSKTLPWKEHADDTDALVYMVLVDAEVAKAQQPYAGMPFEMTIDRIEPERLFAFRWHPFAVERGVDYSSEPTTLVVFALEDVANGTMLTVTESGFDRIPLARRAQAFTANEQGWTMVVTLIEKHLAHAA